MKLGKQHLPDFKAKIPAKPSLGEETMALHLKAHKIDFAREWKFHPTRKWRFDFIIAPIQRHLAIEIEGGIWGGRHTRPQGFIDDCEKYNEAALLDWRVLRFTTDMVKDGTAIQFVQRALA